MESITLRTALFRLADISVPAERRDEDQTRFPLVFGIRKDHSKNFSLEDRLAIGIDRMQRNFGQAASRRMAGDAVVNLFRKTADLPGIHDDVSTLASIEEKRELRFRNLSSVLETVLQNLGGQRRRHCWFRSIHSTYNLASASNFCGGQSRDLCWQHKINFKLHIGRNDLLRSE